jgi:hypothetical protein
MKEPRLRAVSEAILFAFIGLESAQFAETIRVISSMSIEIVIFVFGGGGVYVIVVRETKTLSLRRRGPQRSAEKKLV